MSAKIIILVRISTTKQEILTQKKELIEQHHFHISVKNKIGFIDSTYWDYSSKGHRLHIEQVFSEDRRLDITDTIMKHKRFERKRYDI